jgi:yecA family protein
VGLGQTAGYLYLRCVKQPAYTYDELDEVLRGNGRSGNVGISAIDGMIAALVAGPAFLHPEEWLPIIFAGRVPDVLDGTPEHLAVNTIFDRYNEVSFTLADNPQAYRPMFMNHEGRVIVSDWAAGFMLIVAKRPDAWTKILFTDTRKVLAPIFASHELGVGFLPDIPKAEIDQLRAVAHYHVADAVVALREACAPQRSAAAEITQSQPESRQVRRAARRRAV